MISWLIQTLAAHPDLAAGNPPAGLLSAPELQRVSNLKVLKRRREWLLGRWTAKQLAWAYFENVRGGSRSFPAFYQPEPDTQPIPPASYPQLENLMIGSDQDGAPFVAWAPRPCAPEIGGRWPVSLSISHSEGQAFCALLTNDASRAEPVTLGADVERIIGRHPAFAGDFFTPPEIEQVERAPENLRPTLATLIWSAKEAVLKALHCGLRVDTRCVTCLPAAFTILSKRWAALEIRWEAGQEACRAGALNGWWRVEDGYVYTLAMKA